MTTNEQARYNEADVRALWRFARTHNSSIPDEALDAMRAALEAVLSAPEPAAQGEEVVDRVAKAIADAAGHGLREKCEHMAHAAIAAYQLATWNTAPPTQPAERAIATERQELLEELELVIQAHAGMKAGDEGAPAMTRRVCGQAIKALAAQGQSPAPPTQPAAQGEAINLPRYAIIEGRGGSFHLQRVDGGDLCKYEDVHKSAFFAALVAEKAAPPVQPAERVPVSIEAAIAYIQKKADDHAEENCDVEWDTGATVYRYGQVGEDYHHGLLELVDELTQLASPAPSEGGKGVEG